MDSLATITGAGAASAASESDSIVGQAKSMFRSTVRLDALTQFQTMRLIWESREMC